MLPPEAFSEKPSLTMNTVRFSASDWISARTPEPLLAGGVVSMRRRERHRHRREHEDQDVHDDVEERDDVELAALLVGSELPRLAQPPDLAALLQR